MSVAVSYFINTEHQVGHKVLPVVDGHITLSDIMNAFPVEAVPHRISLVIRQNSPEQVTIIDRYQSAEPLTVRVESAYDFAMNYHWLPSKHDAQTPRVSRTILAHCNGVGGSVNVRCFRKTTDKQVVDLATEQVHSASHTSSQVTIHGVSADSSRMNVQSMIHIQKDLRDVKAHQIHKHLLLNKGARATSEPMLEVLSDDVTCSHGAAIRYLDENQLFYLQSRGFEAEQARDTLVQAFLAA